MIVYFSGTGNSRLIAESLATRLHTESMWLFDAVNIHGNIEGLVFPVYSWGVPPVILDFINRVDLHRLRNGIWCVMTCGDEVAKAPEMLMNALLSKEIEMKGIWSVTMPNNYVLLPGFDTDSKELERKKLDAVAKRVEEIARKI